MLNLIKKLFLKLFKKQKCFYINGPETLPPPLSKEEEQKIMDELQNGIEDNRELLIIHNLRLVVYIAKKFENKTTSTEDLVSIGTIGLMKAVKTFNPEKNIKLATYASRCIENEILMHLRKVNNIKSEMSFDEPLSVDLHFVTFWERTLTMCLKKLSMMMKKGFFAKRLPPCLKRSVIL